MTRVRDRLHGVPLRLRFVAITTALLLIGLAVVGATALTLLHRSLVQQVDDQLTSAAKEVVEQATRTAQGLAGDTASGAPSDYYVQFETADGTPVQTVFNRTSTTSDQFPVIPAMTITEVRNLTSPFTVSSVDGKSSWRVIAGTFSDGSGSVFVALSLHSANVTMAEMQMALLGISLGVVAIGGVTGYVAVRRSLRPLEEIESTAAAIADGDLGRRIPAAPETTEVGRLGVALNGMLTQIESAFDARTASEARMRRFVADASHELRTPLATIRGYGELFRMGALTEDEQLRDTMRRIEGSATRMGNLVEDLLALARMDEGRPMRSDHVDLAVLAGDAVGDLHALDRDRPVRLVPAQDGGSIGPTVVVGDEARLRQVLANLIGNVVQHTPPGTPVEDRTRHPRRRERRRRGPGPRARHLAGARGPRVRAVLPRRRVPHPGLRRRGPRDGHRGGDRHEPPGSRRAPHHARWRDDGPGHAAAHAPRTAPRGHRGAGGHEPGGGRRHLTAPRRSATRMNAAVPEGYHGPS